MVGSGLVRKRAGPFLRAIPAPGSQVFDGTPKLQRQESLIWSGSPAELCRFRERLGNANDNIKLEWQGTPSAEDAVNPAKFSSVTFIVKQS